MGLKFVFLGEFSFPFLLLDCSLVRVPHRLFIYRIMSFLCLNGNLHFTWNHCRHFDFNNSSDAPKTDSSRAQWSTNELKKQQRLLRKLNNNNKQLCKVFRVSFAFVLNFLRLLFFNRFVIAVNCVT